MFYFFCRLPLLLCLPQREVLAMPPLPRTISWPPAALATPRDGATLAGWASQAAPQALGGNRRRRVTTARRVRPAGRHACRQAGGGHGKKSWEKKKELGKNGFDPLFFQIELIVS